PLRTISCQLPCSSIFPYTTLFRSEQFIFFDETARAGIMLPTLTINAVARAIMEHGTGAQKARFLPAILRGACHFAIGYTEPSSGDRKSTRLNSSHVKSSYAVFCLK